MNWVRLFGAATTMLICAHAVADECTDNFVADGNFLSGKTYKTSALIAGVRRADAYSRAYTFTIEHGFTVTSADREAGAISAMQSTSSGRSTPLSVTLRQEAEGTRITLTYATPMGTTSPEDAIKRHFCLTVAAAANNVGASDLADGSDAKRPTPSPSNTAAAQGGAQPASKRTMSGVAVSTAAQHEAINKAISNSGADARLQKMISDAAPAIAAMVERTSCLTKYGESAMAEFSAPGAYLGAWPMADARYHDTSACMTVIRINGWSAPANNALTFEAVYKAEDSGESRAMRHEAVKQPNGEWLFRH